MDLELMDLILKGHLDRRVPILDLGCGEGRNTLFFFQNQSDIYAIDRESSSVKLTQYIAKQLGYKNPQKVQQGEASDLPYADSFFATVLCSRVFHFATSEEHFIDMWSEQVRVLRSGGLLYFTMDSNIGAESLSTPINNSKWSFPDGSIRFLLTRPLLEKLNIDNQFKWLEPMKTINYHDEHVQSVLVLEKR